MSTNDDQLEENAPEGCDRHYHQYELHIRYAIIQWYICYIPT